MSTLRMLFRAFQDLRLTCRQPRLVLSVLTLETLAFALLAISFALVDGGIWRKLSAPRPDELINVAGAKTDREGPLPVQIYSRLAASFDGVRQHFGWVESLLPEAKMGG